MPRLVAYCGCSTCAPTAGQPSSKASTTVSSSPAATDLHEDALRLQLQQGSDAKMHFAKAAVGTLHRWCGWERPLKIHLLPNGSDCTAASDVARLDPTATPPPPGSATVPSCPHPAAARMSGSGAPVFRRATADCARRAPGGGLRPLLPCPLRPPPAADCDRWEKWTYSFCLIPPLATAAGGSRNLSRTGAELGRWRCSESATATCFPVTSTSGWTPSRIGRIDGLPGSPSAANKQRSGF